MLLYSAPDIDGFKWKTDSRFVSTSFVEVDSLTTHNLAPLPSTENHSIFHRWVCFCHVPVFCESLHKHDATLIFGRSLLCSVFVVMRRQLMERFTAEQEKMLPEKRSMVITHFPR